ARHHQQVVVGVDQPRAGLGDQRSRRGLARGERGCAPGDPAAVALHGRALGLGTVVGHDDVGRDAAQARGARQRRGMVDRGMRGHAAARGLRRQGQHGIGGAARLEGADLLQVLALEEQLRAALRIERGAGQHRRATHPARDALARGRDHRPGEAVERGGIGGHGPPAWRGWQAAVKGGARGRGAREPQCWPRAARRDSRCSSSRRARAVLTLTVSCCVVPAGPRLARSSSSRLVPAGRAGAADSSSASTPVSSAAATELPDSKSYWPPGRSVSTCSAGAARAPAGRGCSLALAAITPAMEAGKGACSPAEAPTNVMPRFKPACTSAASSGSSGPARLRLMIGAPEASAPASACASVKVLQAAPSRSAATCQQASNTSSRARGAMPTMPRWLLATAAMTPAMAVPWRSQAGPCGRPDTYEWLSRTRPARSGCARSTPVSMSATRTPSPWVRSWARAMPSVTRLVCRLYSGSLYDTPAG